MKLRATLTAFVVLLAACSGSSATDTTTAATITEEPTTTAAPTTTTTTTSPVSITDSFSIEHDGRLLTATITDGVLQTMGSQWTTTEDVEQRTTTQEWVATGRTYRVGAICGDGWRSYSTGRGTCSWHGGVDYWLVEDEMKLVDRVSTTTKKVTTNHQLQMCSVLSVSENYGLRWDEEAELPKCRVAIGATTNQEAWAYLESWLIEDLGAS